MKTAAVKEKKLYRFAAALVLSLLAIAPAVDASRYVPASLDPPLEPQLSALELLAEYEPPEPSPFELLGFEEHLVFTLGIFLEECELEALNAERSLRPLTTDWPLENALRGVWAGTHMSRQLPAAGSDPPQSAVFSWTRSFDVPRVRLHSLILQEPSTSRRLTALATESVGTYGSKLASGVKSSESTTISLELKPLNLDLHLAHQMAHLDGRFPGGQNLLFQGLWTDPVTGLSYARNRWYDARNASWLSEDPKGAVDSTNLYAFVGWGPHVGTDPMGLYEGAMVNVEVTNEAYMSGELPKPRITATQEEQKVAQKTFTSTVVRGAPVVIVVGGVTAISGPVGLTLAGGLLVDSSIRIGAEHYDTQLEEDPENASLKESILGIGVGRSTGLAEIVELSTGENLDTGRDLTDLEAADRKGRLGGTAMLVVIGGATNRVAHHAKGALSNRAPSSSRGAANAEENAPLVDKVTGEELMLWNEWLKKYKGQGQLSRPENQSLHYRLYRMSGIRELAPGEATPRILVDPSTLQQGAALLEYARIYQQGRTIYLPTDPSAVGTVVTHSEIVVRLGAAARRGQRSAAKSDNQ